MRATARQQSCRTLRAGRASLTGGTAPAAGALFGSNRAAAPRGRANDTRESNVQVGKRTNRICEPPLRPRVVLWSAAKHCSHRAAHCAGSRRAACDRRAGHPGGSEPSGPRGRTRPARVREQVREAQCRNTHGWQPRPARHCAAAARQPTEPADAAIGGDDLKPAGPQTSSATSSSHRPGERWGSEQSSREAWANPCKGAAAILFRDEPKATGDLHGIPRPIDFVAVSHVAETAQ